MKFGNNNSLQWNEQNSSAADRMFLLQKDGEKCVP